jgi:hypothetical protein
MYTTPFTTFCKGPWSCRHDFSTAGPQEQLGTLVHPRILSLIYCHLLVDLLVFVERQREKGQKK